jgi:hypothetical protein
MNFITLELKGESMMKDLLSVKPILTTALLMLLSLGIIAGIRIHGWAGESVKDPTVRVNGSGSVELVWKSGKSEVYSSDAFVKLGGLDTAAFTPSRGWHIETVLFDGNSQVIKDEDGFSLINVEVKRMITVTFVENGGVDDVDTGSNMAANPDPDVGLIFDSILIDGYAYAFLFGLEQDDQVSGSWDIQTTATFDDDITIFLVCNLADLPSGTDPNDLALWKTEWILGDVNLDGIVDGTDVSIIGNANPNEPPDPLMDLNYDGVVNDEDVTIASHNVGLESIWEQLESWIVIEDDFVYVYGVTSSLSIFGVTKRK